MKDILNKLVSGRDLTPAEAENAMAFIMSGGATDGQISAFLTALRMKGETADEIAAFAKVMRKFAVRVQLKPALANSAVDTCGSGGDSSGTFNISTTAAFIAAGAGIPIAKHGNRSVSSKSGSADVLEKLGVKIDLGPEGVKKCVEQAGIGFMFAPQYHGAMKHVAAVRKDIGLRTVFNILGPLASPAEVKHQVYGIFDPGLTERLAEVLEELGSRHALVVHGDGLDELSTLGKTRVSELKNGKITTYDVTPAELGMRKASMKDILGGETAVNAKIVKEILSGKKGAKRDIAVLNAAAAIYVGGGAEDLKKGIKLAEKSIDSGKAMETLERLISVSNGRM